MIGTKRQSLLAWVAGVVFVSILCAHAVSPDPGNLRESVSRRPLLAQAVLRPLPGLSAAQFAPHLSAPAKARFTSTPRPKPKASSLVVPLPRATPAYRHTFSVLSSRRDLTDQYDEIILDSALRHRMDPRLIKSIIAAESEFSNSARSPHGARGLMQVLPGTAEELGVSRKDLSDPQSNIRAGSAYLATLYAAAWKQYKLKGVGYADAPLSVMERIIAAYNAGPRALGRNSWLRHTKNYVRKVLLFYNSDVSEFRRSPMRTAQNGPLPRVDTLP